MTRFATTFIALMLLPLAARANSVMDATLANDVAALQAALIEGSVEATASNGVTPLHVAAAHGYDEIAALLIERGADVDARDRLGNTPLILAAQEGQTDLARRLLAAGADPTAQSIAGGSALAYARGYGHGEIVDLVSPAQPLPVPSVPWPIVMAVLSALLVGAIGYELAHSTAAGRALTAAH